VDLKVNGQGVGERHCAINQIKGRGLCLIQQEPNLPLVVDGESVECCELKPDSDYAVKIGGHFLAIHGSRRIEQWLGGLDCSQWTLRDPATSQVDGPMGFDDLCQFAQDQQRHPQTIVQPHGLSKGFFLHEALEARLMRQAAQADPGLLDGAPGEERSSTTDGGLLTCPVCWLKFDVGDIMHVALHDSLRGDPVLGEDVQQRFHAVQFNDRGQGLDALGLACVELACPHCRHALPPGFLEMKQHIISIVGASLAGKSYYLSVLLKTLPASLFENFSVVFQDADPTGNKEVNEMKQILFSARTPEEALLAKTDFGNMYVRLPRQGRMVALPKPFVFSVASARDLERRCSLIFYDNAGEHFQPGRDSADSPGAQHIASSSGILFLFDPFNHPDFRSRLADGADPQLEKKVIDQQGVILSEMKVRISRLLHIPLTHPIQTPMAMMIGKCDAWMHLLGENAFASPIREGAFDADAVGRNSAKVRQLLKEIAPAVVANAESISRTVVYFPVSAFGHTPVKVEQGYYVPDPRRLRPFQVETPMLWLLSQIAPELVPSYRAAPPPPSCPGN
jgi:hypothetical protein